MVQQHLQIKISTLFSKLLVGINGIFSLAPLFPAKLVLDFS